MLPCASMGWLQDAQRKAASSANLCSLVVLLSLLALAASQTKCVDQLRADCGTGAAVGRNVIITCTPACRYIFYLESLRRDTRRCMNDLPAHG